MQLLFNPTLVCGLSVETSWSFMAGFQTLSGKVYRIVEQVKHLIVHPLKPTIWTKTCISAPESESDSAMSSSLRTNFKNLSCFESLGR